MRVQSRFRMGAGGQELGDKSKSSSLVKWQRQEGQQGHPDCSKRATRERCHVTMLFWAGKIVWALFNYQASDVFESQTGTGSKDFACHDRQCEDNLNRKTFHFRWLSVAQISSLSAQHTRSSNQRDWKEMVFVDSLFSAWDWPCTIAANISQKIQWLCMVFSLRTLHNKQTSCLVLWNTGTHLCRQNSFSISEKLSFSNFWQDQEVTKGKQSPSTDLCLFNNAFSES